MISPWFWKSWIFKSLCPDFFGGSSHNSLASCNSIALSLDISPLLTHLWDIINFSKVVLRWPGKGCPYGGPSQDAPKQCDWPHGNDVRSDCFTTSGSHLEDGHPVAWLLVHLDCGSVCPDGQQRDLGVLSTERTLKRVVPFSEHSFCSLVWVWGSPGLIARCACLDGHLVIGPGPPCTHTKTSLWSQPKSKLCRSGDFKSAKIRE